MDIETVMKRRKEKSKVQKERELILMRNHIVFKEKVRKFMEERAVLKIQRTYKQWIRRVKQKRQQEEKEKVKKSKSALVI